MKLNLFQQNPQVEKYKPDSATRQIESMSLDRKEDLERFRAWMEGTSKEKSDLPDQRELDELNKQTESGKGMSLGLLGVIAAIPIAGIALGGGFGSLTKIANDAMTAITGGGNKPGTGSGNNDNLLGLDTKDKPGSKESIPTTSGNEASKGPLGAGINPTAALNTPSPSSSTPTPTPPAPTATVNTGANQAQKPFPISSPLKGFTKGLEEGSLFGGAGSDLQKKLSDLFKGKNPLRGFLNKVFGSKEGRSELGNLLTKFIRKIPFVGPTIGTLVDVFIFGKENKKTQVKSESAGIGEKIFGGLIEHLGPLGSFLKNVSFKNIGQWFGTWLYSMVFSGGAAVVPMASNQSIQEMLFGKKKNTNNSGINPRTNLPYSESPGKPTTEPPDSKDDGPVTLEEMAARPLKGRTQSRGARPGNALPKADIVIGEKAGFSQSRGRVHAGRDIAAYPGTPLTVPSTSQITDKGFDSGYGNYIIFRDANGIEHMYGHLREPSERKKGDIVEPGDIIGYVGSTGRSSGPHLHWEIAERMGVVGFQRPESQVIDPIEYGYDAQIPFTGGDGSQIEPADGQTPGAPAPTRTTQQRSQQQSQQKQQLNIFDRMMKTLEPLTQTFKLLNDKEFMDSLVLNEDGTVTTKKKLPKTDELFPGMQSILDTVEPSRIPKEVSMLTPEAEAAQERVLIINGGQTVIQTGGQDNFPELKMSSDQPNNTGAILIGAGSDPRELHRLLMSTKIG